MTDGQEKVLLDNNSKINEMIGVLTGGNGGGIVKDVHDNRHDIDQIKDQMVTRGSCETRHASTDKRKHGVGVIAKDVSLVLLSGVVGWIALKGGP